MIIARKSYFQVKCQHGSRKNKIHILILYCSMEMSIKSHTSYRHYQCLWGPACLWPHLLPLSRPCPTNHALATLLFFLFFSFFSFFSAWTHKLHSISSPWYQVFFLPWTILPDLPMADVFSSHVNSSIREVLTTLYKVILSPKAITFHHILFYILSITAICKFH